MKTLQQWKSRAKHLTRDIYALSLAYRDPRVPWYAKVLAACVVGYAFSPIDLIPDPIPVLGYLDDLILLPLGIALVIRLIPPEVLDECKQKAQDSPAHSTPKNWLAAGMIIILWLLTTVFLITVMKRFI